MSRQAEARKHNRECVRENTAATNKTVDYVKTAPAINKCKAGAKPKAKHYPTVDVPYSENNGENCSDEHISAQIEVPYSENNVETCADEQISTKIVVPYSGDNGGNCADEQISAQIEVPYSGDYDPNSPTIIAADASST